MRTRLDAAMVKRGIAVSRTEAARLVAERAVTVSGVIAEKTSRLVGPNEPIEVIRVPRFVGRGGEKLQGALTDFGIDVTGANAIDAGSSTGGFSDCLLQNGAARILAVDVGRNQMHEKIAGDPRVTLLEGVNVRDMRPDHVPFLCSLLVADLSFISLVTVLPALSSLVTPAAEMVLLVKPQFEVGREEASKGRGVITDPGLHRAAVDRVSAEAVRLGWQVAGCMESPIKGGEGNTEFLLHLKRPGRP